MNIFSRKPKDVDFEALNQGAVETARPFNNRMAAIRQRLDQWFERENARPGATISGTAPEEVETAMAKARTELSAALRRYYAQHDTELQAADAAWYARIDEQYDALVSTMVAAQEHEEQRNRLAAVCGVPIRPSMIDSNITRRAFASWKAKALAAIDPPKPKPAFVLADTNRIDLSSLA